jgi:hypothetical protein
MAFPAPEPEPEPAALTDKEIWQRCASSADSLYFLGTEDFTRL